MPDGSTHPDDQGLCPAGDAVQRVLADIAAKARISHDPVMHERQPPRDRCVNREAALKASLRHPSWPPGLPDCECEGRGYQWANYARTQTEPCTGCGYRDLAEALS